MDHVQEAVGVLQEGIQLADRYEAEADGGYALFAGGTNYSYGAFQTFQRQVREAYSFRKSMADLYVRLGDIGQAEHYLSEAIERYPDSYELYLKRAEVFNRSGNKNALKRIWHGRLKRRRTITARISTWPGFIARMVWRIRPTS